MVAGKGTESADCFVAGYWADCAELDDYDDAGSLKAGDWADCAKLDDDNGAGGLFNLCLFSTT